MSPVAYELELPVTLKRVHPVFHVSLLKAQFTDPINPMPDVPPPPVVDSDGEEEFTVGEIITHRVRWPRGVAVLEYLVRWAGYSAEHDEWLPLSSVDDCAALDVYEHEMTGLGQWPPDMTTRPPQHGTVARPKARPLRRGHH